MGGTPDDLMFLFRVLHWLLLLSPLEGQVCRCPQCLNPELGYVDGAPEDKYLTPGFVLGCAQCSWNGTVREIIESAMLRSGRSIVDPKPPEFERE